MEDRDYRSEVGKKIEEALANGDFDLIEDLIEVPPMETFMQWADKGEEKRKKRVCRKRILVSCLAIVVVSASVLIGLKCFALPEVTADPEDRMGMDINDMENVVIYESWKDIPIEVQEQFVEVKNLPEAYEVKEIKHSKGKVAEKLEIYIPKNNVEIRQYVNLEGGLPTNTVSADNMKINLEGVEIYVENNEELKITTYKLIIESVMIDVIVPLDMEEEAKRIIKTVL